MKVCPECNKTYDDDLPTCPDDGAELVDARLPRNPELREVLPVNPSEATSVIDLEAIEQARRERMIARGEDPDAEPEPEPEPEPPDPDATGTIDLAALERKRKAKEAEAAGTDGDGDGDGDATAKAEDGAPEKTLVTRGRRPTPASAEKPEKKSRPPVVIAAVLGGAVLLAAGLAVGLIFAFGAWNGAVLTVTTVPPGATVLIDGAEVGRAPLQRRVKVGSHAIELMLDGYEPFKEVVDVPSEGLPFMQPLRALPKPAPEPEPEPGPDPGEADALVTAIEGLIEAGELDEAFEKVKELLKLFPGDARGDQLLDRVVEARMKANEERDKRSSRRQRRDDDRPRKDRARDACDEGERLLLAGEIPDAKVKLQTCIQLDPRSSRPHRLLARVYQREDNVDRTRYHLQRYLALGGKDRDYKVRRWLEDHPAK